MPRRQKELTEVDLPPLPPEITPLPPDSIIYRMSGAGDCVRVLVAKQYEHPEVRFQERQDLMDRSAEEGNLHEQAVKAMLRKQGFRISGEQDEYRIQIVSKVWLIGHGDGLISPDNLTWVDPDDLLEVKSMSSLQFAKWLSGRFNNFPRYAGQITSYMEANPGRRVRYVVKRREDGLTDTSFIEAGNPPIPFREIRNKILTAERYRRKGDYPPCDIKNQWGCPFWYLHDEKEEEYAELTPEMEMVLAELVTDYRRLHALEKDGEAAAAERKEKINPDILRMLGKEGVVEIVVGDETFTVRKQKGGGKRVDLDLMRAENPDFVAKFERSYSYEYPVVREKKGKR